MKSLSLIAACLLAGLTGARADVKIVKGTQIRGVATSNAIWIRGTKMRTDISNTSVGDISIIVDHSTGDALFLLHKQKRAGQISGAEKERVVSGYEAEAQTEAVRNEPIKLVDTGQTEKFQQYTTRIYTWKKTGFSQKLWVAQNPAALPKNQKELTLFNEGYAPKNGKAQLQALAGLIVKAETEAEGMTRTEVVVNVEETQLAPAMFEKPADYELRPMPQPAGK